MVRPSSSKALSRSTSKSFGKDECISVADSSFCYSDSNVTVGFHRTRALGGPMRNGLQVRISPIGDTIVRVEVAEEP
jgi:hypothetical protein